MKLKFITILSTLLLSLIFSFENVQACSCVIQEACQSFSSAKVVFVGKVLDSTEKIKTVKRREQRIGSSEWEENEYSEKRRISRIQVEESFLGTNEKTEIFIET